MHFCPRPIAVMLTAGLAACSNAPPLAPADSPHGPSVRGTLVIAGAARPVRHDRDPSRLRRAVASEKLLYVSDPATDDVQIFAFPSGAPVGTLTGFAQPQGECTDKNGDVFVANTQASNVLEFAHGGTQPIAILADPGQYPVACSVNPRTGDLAVSNAFDTNFYGAGVSVYKRAAGSPRVYAAPMLWEAFFLSYDGVGNIFVDGLSSDGSYRFIYAELPKGASTFSVVTIDAAIVYPGGVLWTGQAMAVGDQEYSPTQAAVYQVQTSGSVGTVVGTTILDGRCDLVQFFVERRRLIGPDPCKGNVGVYAYPDGGGHLGLIQTGLKQPVGSAISIQPLPTPTPSPSPSPSPTPTPPPSPTPSPPPSPTPTPPPSSTPSPPPSALPAR